MEEYIIKEYIYGILTNHLNNSKGAEHYAYDCVKQEIDHAPDTEVVHMKHGQWMKYWCDNNLIGHEYEECSICGCSMIDTNQFWDSKFCPNCGARMIKEN